MNLDMQTLEETNYRKGAEFIKTEFLDTHASSLAVSDLMNPEVLSEIQLSANYNCYN